MTANANQVAGGRDTHFTATPLSDAAIAAQTAAKVPARPTLDSEFCRPQDCSYLFGLKRGMVYLLEKEGLIKTVSLRRRGQARGVKLIHIGSVRAYLNGVMNARHAA